MLRQKHQKHGWVVTMGLAAAVGLIGWAVASHLKAEVGEVRQERDVQGLPMLEFQRLFDKGDVLAVDVRNRASYETGRIAGAIHVPLDDLEAGPLAVADVKRLARGRLVVTYCSCPSEASSLRAARVLVASGVPAKALIGGYPKWAAAGGRVEHGTPVR